VKCDVDRRSELATTGRRNPDHCTTCGDIAVPMEVLQVDEARGLALCTDDEGTHATVEIALIGAVNPGDGLLVHAGVALTRT
jgi:hydrogenase maturation factor